MPANALNLLKSLILITLHSFPKNFNITYWLYNNLFFVPLRTIKTYNCFCAFDSKIKYFQNLQKYKKINKIKFLVTGTNPQ